jgi:glycine cleavage system transcriptional repressor
MSLYAVTVVGVDQPGNLAAVAGALVERGCNIEDSEMAVLRGHSAMMLVVSEPSSEGAGPAGESLGDHLVKAVADRGLNVTVHPIDSIAPADAGGEPWSVAIHGADRPGILFEVTRLLARTSVNITGVKTRAPVGPARPQYAMALQVSVPPGVDGDHVAAQLDKLAGELNLACSMRPEPVPDSGLRQSP